MALAKWRQFCLDLNVLKWTLQSIDLKWTGHAICVAMLQHYKSRGPVGLTHLPPDKMAAVS